MVTVKKVMTVKKVGTVKKVMTMKKVGEKGGDSGEGGDNEEGDGSESGNTTIQNQIATIVKTIFNLHSVQSFVVLGPLRTHNTFYTVHIDTVYILQSK